jgi:hypothetical protein
MTQQRVSKHDGLGGWQGTFLDGATRKPLLDSR